MNQTQVATTPIEQTNKGISLQTIFCFIWSYCVYPSRALPQPPSDMPTLVLTATDASARRQLAGFMRAGAQLRCVANTGESIRQVLNRFNQYRQDPVEKVYTDAAGTTEVRQETVPKVDMVLYVL